MEDKGIELETYMKEYLKKAYDKDELRLLDASYQEEFKEEGSRKSEYIIEDLRKKSKEGYELDRLILLSIGGADGSEVVSILERTGINKAIMIEIMEDGAETARASAVRLARQWPKSDEHPGKEFKVICGDAMDKLEDALNIIEGWREEDDKLDGLVLSCQAVLHELPQRSNGSYDHGRFFGKIFRDHTLNTKAIYIKEPCFPENWSGIQEVLIKIPGVSGKTLESFATHVSDRLRIDSSIEYLAHDKVRLTPELALETLHKAIRKNTPSRLFYELGEQLTSFSASSVREIIKNATGLVCQDRPLQTDGFNDALREYKVQFESTEFSLLPSPQSHVVIVGFDSRIKIRKERKTTSQISIHDDVVDQTNSLNKETWRKDSFNFDNYEIDSLPLVEIFDPPLLKADVVTEIETGKEISKELLEYYEGNIEKMVEKKLSSGKALTNGKGYSLKRVLIQKDPLVNGGRYIRPHFVFEPAEYFHQLMFSERMDEPGLINGRSIRETLGIDFKTFDWPTVSDIALPQRFANVVGVVLPVSRDKPDELCLVVAIRSGQTLVSDDSSEEYYQSSMSCAEGMLRPDDAEYGISDRYPPSPFNTAERALKEELNITCGVHYLQKDIEMLALGYDSNRCQPVAVFKLEIAPENLCFEDLVTNWMSAKDRNENQDLLPILLNRNEFSNFLNGNILYKGKPIKMFSNHQLLGACVVGKYYLGSLQ